MNDGFKEDIDVMPSLTFEPFKEEAPIAKVKEETKQAEVLDESYLTEEEKKMVDEFVEKIEITNSNSILQYGVGAQKKIADFSESALNNVKTKDLGEVGEMLSSVVCELKSFEAPEEKKGILGLFKKTTEKVSQMRVKYDKVEGNINKICTMLETHQIQLLKDIAMLDKMYEINKVYFKELSMYILAGKKKLSKLEKEELPILAERAKIVDFLRMHRQQMILYLFVTALRKKFMI